MTAPTPRDKQDGQPPAAPMTGRQKAAIIVRLLLDQGVDMPIADLPEHHQAALTEQFADMRMVDRETLQSVVEEFTAQMETAGLTFPDGVEGALSMLDGHISDSAANRLRRLATVSDKSDPWERIATLEPRQLLPALQDESAEICAIVLSKLPVEAAAHLLEQLRGDKARRIAYAMSRTADVDPRTVRRIGLAVLSGIDSRPPRAFAPPPAARIGAILNESPAPVRDEVLESLDATDAALAQAVRREIFTFAHIPVRIAPRDLQKVLREVEQDQLVTALAAAQHRGGDDGAAAEAILNNVSQRMADMLRESMEDGGRPRQKAGDAAMAELVSEIRRLVRLGEITLRSDEDDDDDPAQDASAAE